MALVPAFRLPASLHWAPSNIPGSQAPATGGFAREDPGEFKRFLPVNTFPLLGVCWEPTGNGLGDWPERALPWRKAGLGQFGDRRGIAPWMWGCATVLGAGGEKGPGFTPTYALLDLSARSGRPRKQAGWSQRCLDAGGMPPRPSAL